MSARRLEQGFTLLAVLFVVAALGVGLAALGTAWETAARRERETQLLFVGEQYRRALESYRQATPGSAKVWPRTLHELLLDPRFPYTVRHLRRLYPDPLTGKPEWGWVKDGDGISGVYSLAEGKPLKQAGFAAAHQAFAGAQSYRDWVFLAKGDSAREKGAGKTPGLPAPRQAAGVLTQ